MDVSDDALYLSTVAPGKLSTILQTTSAHAKTLLLIMMPTILPDIHLEQVV